MTLKIIISKLHENITQKKVIKSQTSLFITDSPLSTCKICITKWSYRVQRTVNFVSYKIVRRDFSADAACSAGRLTCLVSISWFIKVVRIAIQGALLETDELRKYNLRTAAVRFSFVSANVSLTSNSDGVRERGYNLELNSMMEFQKLWKFPVLQSFPSISFFSTDKFEYTDY